jgi:hypothetical protein
MRKIPVNISDEYNAVRKGRELWTSRSPANHTNGREISAKPASPRPVTFLFFWLGRTVADFVFSVRRGGGALAGNFD